MGSFRDGFEEDVNAREARTPDADRPLTLTPLHELARADGYRWASLDTADLDPPTSLPPY